MLVRTIIISGFGSGIHVVNADGSGSVHIGGDAEYNQEPDWSPDGQRLAFVTRRTGGGGLDIVNADGTNRVALTTEEAYYENPQWQPVATTTPTPEAELAIYVEADKRVVASGEQVIYTIRVSNNGPAPQRSDAQIQLPRDSRFSRLQRQLLRPSDEDGRDTARLHVLHPPDFAPGETHVVTLTNNATGAPHAAFVPRSPSPAPRPTLTS